MWLPRSAERQVARCICYQGSAGLRLVFDRHMCVFTQGYDTTCLVTNTAGKLDRYLVDDGACLYRGMPYAEIDGMQSDIYMGKLPSLVN
ncbi:Acetyl-CoA carboxylase [Phytophthora megakarya]|uniref:Acetyl-CoA carboxylase n=1 Tax=Phytophthora megakarya TaxID=4795 RepID=A0A225WQ24_9STRA|nr:Acetyl-CoA carboxylase [Phytophthora megakarya]